MAACFAIQAVFIGALFAYGVFFKEFQAEFGWSRATISGASSLAFLIMGIVGILAGRLNDKIGPRLLIVVSGCLFGLGYLLLHRLQSPWHLYILYGVIVGIGLSTHDVVTLSTVARWFEKRRGMMTGIVKIGTGSGQLLLPLIATSLIEVFGWRDSCFIIGLLALVALVAVAQIMRRDPQEIGLLPDGIKCERSDLVSGFEKSNVTPKEAFRSRQFWTLCIAQFAIFFCLFTIVVHIVPHARDLGLPPATAAGVLSTVGGVSILGRIVMGSANDRIGGKRSLLICFIVLLCGLVWLQVASKPWMLFLFAVVYGLAHGGFFTVMSPTVAELFGTKSHGLLFGFVLFCGTLGAAVGPLMAGSTFDMTGNYRMGFLILTALATIGLALTTLLRATHGVDAGK